MWLLSFYLCYVAIRFVFSISNKFVLGGGKDLAAAASIQETRDSKLKQEDTKVKNEAKPSPMLMYGNNKMMGNMGMGASHDMMRNPPSKLIHFNLV